MTTEWVSTPVYLNGHTPPAGGRVMGRNLAAPDHLAVLAEETVQEAYNFFRDDCPAWRRRGGSGRVRERTPEDLRCARDEATRLLEGSEFDDGNEFAIGANELIVDYVVGLDGLQYEAEAAEGQTADPGLLATLNTFVQSFHELNNLTELEQETVWRWGRDGEAFCRLFDCGPYTVPEVEFVEPERVRPPSDADLAARWPWGIETDPYNARRRVAYWVEPEPGADPEPVPEPEIVHTRVNALRTQLRGWPTFEPVRRALVRAEQLAVAGTATGIAQAKLALLWKRSNFSRAKADGMVNQLTQKYQHSPNGDPPQLVSVQQLPDGAVINTSKDDEVTPFAQSQNGPNVETLIQVNLRMAGQRLYRMPEWMFTGLADAKYSNAFVVEAPTLKAFLRLQRKLSMAFGEGRLRQQASLLWRAVRVAVRNGLLPPQVLTACRIRVTPPTLQTRDKQAEATRNVAYIDAQVFSRREVQRQEGVDPDVMSEEIQEEAKLYGLSGKRSGLLGGDTGSGPGGGNPPAPPTPPVSPGPPTPESLLVTDADGGEWLAEARDISRLVRKVIATKRGHKMTVYVRADDPSKVQARHAKDPILGAAEDAVRRALADPSRLTGDELAGLANVLRTIPRDRLQQLNRESGHAGGRTREDAAARIRGRVEAGAPAAAVWHAAEPRPGESGAAFAVRHFPALAPLGRVLAVEDATAPESKRNVEDLARVPPAVHAAAAAAGLKGVYVSARPVTEVGPWGHLKGQRPRGWPAGSTWDSVAGAYDPGEKAVAAGKGEHGSASLALHEYAHGLGHLLGWNDDPALAEHHARLHPKLDPYEQQGGPGAPAGREEMLAESFAVYHALGRGAAVKGYDEDYVAWLESKVKGVGHAGGP